MGYSPWSCKKSDATEHALMHGKDTKYTKPLITTTVCTYEFCTVATINASDYDFSGSQM